MGKIRTRFIGIEEVEEAQKIEQKKRAAEKKAQKKNEEDSEVSEDAAQVAPVAAPEPTEKRKKEAASTSQKAKGKKYRDAQKLVDSSKIYSITEGIALLKKMSYVKFDESVEIHLNLLTDGLRGEVALPHSTGRVVRVAVLDDAILADLDVGKIEFDILIAHPSQMPKIARYAKMLGPKGLMPNPKAGTVSPEPEKAAEKFKKGTLRWKAESKFPILHQMVSKLSAEPHAIEENVRAFIESVGAKHIKSAYLTASMTPSVQISIA